MYTYYLVTYLLSYLVTYLLTYLLTVTMVQSPSWETNWFAASQEIPRISRTPKVLYRTHQRACECFLIWMFHKEGLLALRPTPKLEDHPLSAVRDCLFNIFATTLPIGSRSSIRNLRTRHAVVTGTHYTVIVYIYIYTYNILYIVYVCIYILYHCTHILLCTDGI